MISEGRLAHILERLVKLDNLFDAAWDAAEKGDETFSDYMIDIHSGLKKAILQFRVLDKPMEEEDPNAPS